MLYMRPFRPSNLMWNCSGGRFSAQRKQGRAAMASGEVSAVVEMIRSGLNWTRQGSPKTASSLISTDLSERKLAAASGHTDSWSWMNLRISCITGGLAGRL